MSKYAGLGPSSYKWVKGGVSPGGVHPAECSCVEESILVKYIEQDKVSSLTHWFPYISMVCWNLILWYGGIFTHVIPLYLQKCPSSVSYMPPYLPFARTSAVFSLRVTIIRVKGIVFFLDKHLVASIVDRTETDVNPMPRLCRTKSSFELIKMPNVFQPMSSSGAILPHALLYYLSSLLGKT